MQLKESAKSSSQHHSTSLWLMSGSRWVIKTHSWWLAEWSGRKECCVVSETIILQVCRCGDYIWHRQCFCGPHQLGGKNCRESYLLPTWAWKNILLMFLIECSSHHLGERELDARKSCPSRVAYSQALAQLPVGTRLLQGSNYRYWMLVISSRRNAWWNFMHMSQVQSKSTILFAPVSLPTNIHCYQHSLLPTFIPERLLHHPGASLSE